MLSKKSASFLTDCWPSLTKNKKKFGNFVLYIVLSICRSLNIVSLILSYIYNIYVNIHSLLISQTMIEMRDELIRAAIGYDLFRKYCIISC